MAVLKVPPTQLVLEGALTPAPEIFTIIPVSQVPPTVSPVWATVPAAGEVIRTKGAVVSRLKFLLSVPVLPAPSVCEATTFLTPSPALKVIAVLKAPATQEVVEGPLTPAPEIFTIKPVSQVPPMVSPVWPTVPAAGEVIRTMGSMLSRTKVLSSKAELPAESVCVALTNLSPSPALKRIAAEKALEAQAVVTSA
jgi:hypothetical protein